MVKVVLRGKRAAVLEIVGGDDVIELTIDVPEEEIPELVQRAIRKGVALEIRPSEEITRKEARPTEVKREEAIERSEEPPVEVEEVEEDILSKYRRKRRMKEKETRPVIEKETEPKETVEPKAQEVPEQIEEPTEEVEESGATVRVVTQEEAEKGVTLGGLKFSMQTISAEEDALSLDELIRRKKEAFGRALKP